MPQIVSALTARTQLGQILQRVKQKQERFVVDRRGQPQAIIMGIDDFINTIAPPPEFLKALWAESKRTGRTKLTMRDIDREIKAARTIAKKPVTKRAK